MSETVETSAYDLKAVEIFKLILEDGMPKTAYDLIFKKNQPVGTVHRHLDKMIKNKEIVIYSQNEKRGKKLYGPTFTGFINFYDIDDDFTKNLEIYFDLWKNNKIFLTALEAIGFDEKKMKEHPEKCKNMFRELIVYCAMCEKAYDMLAENPYRITYEAQQFIGGILLANNKKANQTYEELYAFSAPFRNAMDFMILQIVQRHNKIKNNSKELMKKWE